MPPVTRVDVDASTGHDCFVPRPNTPNGSPDVFVNNLGVVRVSDPWPPHCCGPSCHDGNQSSGSTTVFVNGLALTRIGDAISCGDASAAGSPDVICG